MQRDEQAEERPGFEDRVAEAADKVKLILTFANNIVFEKLPAESATIVPTRAQWVYDRIVAQLDDDDDLEAALREYVEKQEEGPMDMNVVIE